MKRAICILAACIGALSDHLAFADTPATATLRFDGVYQAHPGGGSQSLYIRFYRDDYVVVMSYAGPPEDVTEFITRNFSSLPQGRYQLAGSKVTFTTKAARGEIDYSGVVDGSGLSAHVHSRVTDYASDERFIFHKETFPDAANSSRTANQSTDPTPASVTSVAGQPPRHP